MKTIINHPVLSAAAFLISIGVGMLAYVMGPVDLLLTVLVGIWLLLCAVVPPLLVVVFALGVLYVGVRIVRAAIAHSGPRAHMRLQQFPPDDGDSEPGRYMPRIVRNRD